MKFEGMKIYELFKTHVGNVIIIDSEEKTLFNSLISGDYSPDILLREIKSFRIVENIPVITVKD